MQLMVAYILILSCVFMVIPAVANWLPNNPWAGSPETAECTTAIISGRVAPNGRTILWKNRDVSNWHQEFRFYDTEPYSFIGLNYPFIQNEYECYGGINEVGFAIENSNALNFPDCTGYYDDDGIIMYHALQTCASVEDFLAYMDTTAQQGRTRPSNYGVFDALGGAGILEASKYENYWFDANDTVACPEGFLIRSNFAYMGSFSGLIVGRDRHNRAYELIEEALSSDSLTLRFIFDVVGRDLYTEDLNPYPLPYAGYYVYGGDTLEGAIRDHNAINREITQSGFVAQAVTDGENPLLTMMWAMVGEPLITPVLPLWIGAFSVPMELVGADPDSPMNLRLRELFEYVYYMYPDPYDDLLDTYKLDDAQGNGVLNFIRNLEDGYYEYVMDLTEQWIVDYPGADNISFVQDSLCSLVFNALNTPREVQNLTVEIDNLALRLEWSPVNTSIVGDSIEVQCYVVYGFDSAYSNLPSDTIGYTNETFYIIGDALLNPFGFYQVKAQYSVGGDE